MYRYECPDCKHSLEVIRSLSEWDTPPTTAEVEEAGLSLCVPEKEPAQHAWTRVVGGNITLYRGRNWNGAKGHW